jgi:sugar lactone lactonase YvrE
MQGAIDPEVLVDGLLVGESPRWHHGRLWFAHWGAGEILAADPLDEKAFPQRTAEVPDRIPFSLDWLPDGRLLVVTGAELLTRPFARGPLERYADLSSLSSLGFNELVVDARGNAYVNGAGFDMMAGAPFSPGGIVVVRPDGSAEWVADEIAFPNGMAITADDRTLIVADSYGKCLTAFAIAGDGTLSDRRTWADLGDGVPDGICVDADGAVWYADVPNKRCVRVREGGQVLHTVECDRGCFACMLGGDDGRTLYILAAAWDGPERMFAGPRSGRILAVPAPAAHAGRP